MDLTQEEINTVLEAGLEKVAYEEGLNDYAESLEKVAGVHGVDAMDLHDFLETNGQMEKEAAEDEGKSGLSKKQLAALTGGTAGAAGAGAAGVAGLGAKRSGGISKLKELAEKGDLSKKELASNVMGEGVQGLKNAGGSALQALKNNKSKAGLGAAGLAGLGAAGAYANKKRNQKNDKQKTAAAYGLDEETFDALFEAGVDALTE